MNQTRLFWLLRGDRVIASSRLQGYLIHEQIQAAHLQFHSELMLAPPIWLYEPPWTDDVCRQFADAARGGVVVLQKMFSEEIGRIPSLIRRGGGLTVFVHSDLDEDNQIPFDCDLVIVPSQVLADWYMERGCKNVRIIHDPNENKFDAPQSVSEARTELTIGWIGHENNWPSLDTLRQTLADPSFSDFRLVTVSNHDEADVPWSPENVVQAMPRFDLAVIPFGSSPELKFKSANRATLFMGAGIPVVTGRLPAYEEVIEHGRNGFLFDGQEELQKCLHQLRDPTIRQAISQQTFQDAQRFSVEASTQQWVDAIEELLPDQRVTTKVDREQELKIRRFQYEQHMAMSDYARRKKRNDAAKENAAAALRIGLKHPGNGRIMRPLKTLANLKGLFDFGVQRSEW